ncbi:hypothetical protein ACFQ07_21415, partial [Actinomadura adrarensis]
MVGMVGSILIIVFGLVTALAGFLDQNSADKAYVVEFKHLNEECSPAHELHINVSNGEPLPCVRSGFLPTSHKAQLEGFTEAQTDQVTKLAALLGRNGLSETEQHQIQAEVDRILASVPEAGRKQYTATVRIGGLWGEPLGWVAIGAVVVSALGCAGCFRLAAGQ